MGLVTVVAATPLLCILINLIYIASGSKVYFLNNTHQLEPFGIPVFTYNAAQALGSMLAYNGFLYLKLLVIVTVLFLFVLLLLLYILQKEQQG